MSLILQAAIDLADEMTDLCTPMRTAESTLRLTKGFVELSEWPCDHHGARAFGFVIRGTALIRDWQMSYQVWQGQPVPQVLAHLVDEVRRLMLNNRTRTE